MVDSPRLRELAFSLIMHLDIIPGMNHSGEVSGTHTYPSFLLKRVALMVRMATAKHGEGEDLRPEDGEAVAFQEDAADDFQEVAQRDEVGGPADGVAACWPPGR